MLFKNSDKRFIFKLLYLHINETFNLSQDTVVLKTMNDPSHEEG